MFLLTTYPGARLASKVQHATGRAMPAVRRGFCWYDLWPRHMIFIDKLLNQQGRDNDADGRSLAL